MKSTEYIRLAERTANRGPEDTINKRLIMCALGLVGEAGEICDQIKKVRFHDHAFDRDAFIKELGDELWYIAIAVSTLGIDIEPGWVTAAGQQVQPVDTPAALHEYALSLAVAAAYAANSIAVIGSRTDTRYVVRETIAQVTPFLTSCLTRTLELVACLAKSIGCTLDEIAETNIDKLRKRYPDGFDREHSIHRAV